MNLFARVSSKLVPTLSVLELQEKLKQALLQVKR